MNAPDQSGAIAVDPDEVDPPQRPVAGQPLLEERRHYAGQAGLADRAPGNRGDVAPNVERSILYPEAVGSLTAQDDLQHLYPLDPRADQLAQLLDRGRGRAEEDHLAGVTGDSGALEVKDRPILGTERDHVSRMDVWCRHVRRRRAMFALLRPRATFVKSAGHGAAATESPDPCAISLEDLRRGKGWARAHPQTAVSRLLLCPEVRNGSSAENRPRAANRHNTCSELVMKGSPVRIRASASSEVSLKPDRPRGDTSSEVMEQASRPLGGLVWRPRPRVGIRPTVRFGFAFTFTLAYVAFGVYVSQSWRADLESAIGPVMAWVIPTMLAYIPGLLIGFLAFTLITTRYRPPDLDTAQRAPGRTGRWPSVTLIVAAWNEEDAIAPTLERLAELSYPGPLRDRAGGQQLDRPDGRARARGGAQTRPALSPDL